MQYYETDQRSGKWWGALATLLYVALWVVLILMLKFPVEPPVATEQGIMINFGDDQSAGGEQDTAFAEQRADAARPEAGADEPDITEPVPTGQVEVRRPETTVNKPREESPPQRRADPRSLFPGRTTGSTSASEGASTGAGNQGNPNGSPGGSHSGTGGVGNSGESTVSLRDRNLVGALPRPDYNSNREGRVVVEITVNGEGFVTAAAYRASGSVGVDNVMVQDALRAARKARFDTSQTEGVQSGTITYVFKMK